MCFVLLLNCTDDLCMPHTNAGQSGQNAKREKMTPSDYYNNTTKALWTMINHICFIGFHRSSTSLAYILPRGSVSLRTYTHCARF